MTECRKQSLSGGKGCVPSVGPNLISRGNSQYTNYVSVHLFFDEVKDKARHRQVSANLGHLGHYVGLFVVLFPSD